MCEATIKFQIHIMGAILLPFDDVNQAIILSLIDMDIKIMLDNTKV